MEVTPNIEHLNGIVSVTMVASFIGAPTDATDQQRILAYGDPKVNLAGLFSDPADPTFQFTFPTSSLYVGITTQMQNYTAQFMTALPSNPPSTLVYSAGPFTYQPGVISSVYQQQGPLTCIVSDPVRAATIWAAAIDTEVGISMATLRLKTPAQLTSLPIVNV